MEGKQLRCVLIGCGPQMRDNLVPFLHRLNRHTIVACVDPNEVLAQNLARMTGAKLSVRDVEELDITTIDAAIIAVPPTPSYHVTRYLVRHRIACFVEKPAGPSTPVLESMWREAQNNNTYVQVGFNFRYAEAISHLYHISYAQRQEPHCLTIDFLSRHPSGPQWERQDTIDAWFRHNGVHALDLAQWLIPSPVEKVQAHLITQDGHKFLGTVVLRHANDAISLLRVGNQTKDFVIRVDVHGRDGSRYHLPNLEGVRLDMDAGKTLDARLFATRNLDHGWARSGFGPELQQFFDVACTKSLPELKPPTLEDAYKTSQLCDKIMEAIGIEDTECVASLY
jgi:predicted dehydrogenase